MSLNSSRIVLFFKKNSSMLGIIRLGGQCLLNHHKKHKWSNQGSLPHGYQTSHPIIDTIRGSNIRTSYAFSRKGSDAFQ